MLLVRTVFLLMTFDVAMVVEMPIRAGALYNFMTHFATLGALDSRSVGAVLVKVASLTTATACSGLDALFGTIFGKVTKSFAVSALRVDARNLFVNRVFLLVHRVLTVHTTSVLSILDPPICREVGFKTFHRDILTLADEVSHDPRNNDADHWIVIENIAETGVP